MFNHLQESFNSDEPSCALSPTSWYHRHTFIASLYMFHPKCMRTEQLHPWVQIIGKKPCVIAPNSARQNIPTLRITYEPLSECSILLTILPFLARLPRIFLCCFMVRVVLDSLLPYRRFAYLVFSSHSLLSFPPSFLITVFDDS
jgi:hypothetical protein